LHTGEQCVTLKVLTKQVLFLIIFRRIWIMY